MTVKLRFIKLQQQNMPAARPSLASFYLDTIGIKVEHDQDPAKRWIQEMHIENNIPYVPGLISIEILQEIESNPDIQRWVDFLGIDFDDYFYNEKEMNEIREERENIENA